MDAKVDAAWAVIVQHLQHPQQLCTLLCVSKELASLIHTKCRNQLYLAFTAGSLEHQSSFAEWLAAHSSLLSCSLDLTLWRPQQPVFSPRVSSLPPSYENGEIANETDSPGDQSSEPEDDVTTTLSAAETNGISTEHSHSQQQLQQQQYEHQQELALSSAAAVIRQLPIHLTELTLHCDFYQELANNPSVVAAISSLSSLQHLNLDSSVSVCSAPFFRALSGLPNLKELSVKRIICVSKLRHLPASLECLNLGICSPGLQLTHLTNLTSLRSQDRFLPIQSNDFLPPSLQQIVVGECHSVQRLVQLKNLRSLDIGASNIPARRLQRLAASLKHLTEVKLSYRTGFNEAAAAWGDLPLKHLELESCVSVASERGARDGSRAVISATTVQELSKLTQLTYLHIAHLDALEATKQQLADMLQELTALEGLKLWSSGTWPLLRDTSQQQQQLPQPQQNDPASSSRYDTSLAAAAAAVLEGADRPSSPASIAVMHAIASLPNLTSVSLSLQNLGHAAAAELAAATQLTSLKLRACGVGDSTIKYVAQNLTNLRSLFAEYNRDISDEVLEVLARGLKQLTELDIRYTSVSEDGKQFLRTLQRLKQLQV